MKGTTKKLRLRWSTEGDDLDSGRRDVECELPSGCEMKGEVKAEVCGFKEKEACGHAVGYTSKVTGGLGS